LKLENKERKQKFLEVFRILIIKPFLYVKKTVICFVYLLNDLPPWCWSISFF